MSSGLATCYNECLIKPNSFMAFSFKGRERCGFDPLASEGQYRFDPHGSE